MTLPACSCNRHLLPLPQSDTDRVWVPPQTIRQKDFFTSQESTEIHFEETEDTQLSSLESESDSTEVGDQRETCLSSEQHELLLSFLVDSVSADEEYEPDSEESEYEDNSMIDELDASFLDDPFMADVAFKEAPEIVTGSRDGNNSESIKQSFMTASRLENSPEEAVNERVVCDVDCIIQPLGKTCRQPNCQASISYKKIM
ncbi:uncharacterized protein LOC134183475 isoform X2 [Corticium candelabrum]|uniref:uncharacterized protein LOC134183475 isoform X2 n=1 Tax=Corticium candelabrum TaxID=121492 RepID=UPI002E274A40|nr:uncharacterized protein LOC134183475 isoform X2 [Corticium candelabrum]